MFKAIKVLAIALMLCSSLSANAADEQKSDLVQIIRQEKGGKSALAVTKLMTFNLSPTWWQYFLNRDNHGYQLISNLADGVMTFGQNYGGDDITALDTTNDGSSPLVGDALDKLAAKAHFTLEMSDAVQGKENIDRLIDNIALIQAPIGEKYYCKPRGGKLYVIVTLDPKGKALRCDVSKDGNTYHFYVPAYVEISTSPIEEALKRGT